MENNTPPQPVTPVVPTPQVVLPNTPQATVVTAPKQGGSKMVIVIILILVVLILAAGGYLYMMNQSKKNVNNAAVEQPDSSVTTLNTEINAIDVGSDTDGFTEIDQGLQNL